MRIRRSVVCALTAMTMVAGLVGAPAASAASPWKRFTTGDVQASEIGSLRTADGKLHVVWPVVAGPTDASIDFATFSAGGALLNHGVAIAHWTTLELTPKLVPFGTGLRLVFNGVQNTVTGNPYGSSNRFSATSPDGVGWTLQPGSLSYANEFNITIAATTEADGTPVTMQGENQQLVYHVGADPTSPAAPTDGVINAPTGADFLAPTLVRAVDGSVWVGYFQAYKTIGYYVQQVLPTLGAPIKAPGSGQEGLADNRPGQQTALVATKAGLFLAYCTPSVSLGCVHVNVWKVGSPKAVVAPGSTGTVDRVAVALSAGAGGRLALTWWSETKKTVDVVWTNHADTKLSPVQVLPQPPNLIVFDSLAIEASGGPADLFANVLPNVNHATLGYWHARALPALTLGVSAKAFSHKTAAKLTFKVTDVGDPVAGVKVAFNGRSATTNAKGIAVLKLAKGVGPGKRTATATRTGWRAGSVSIKTT